MSADNSIVILETKGPEFRVLHMQAMENIDWDEEAKEYTRNDDVRIKNAREYGFQNCRVFTDETQAFQEADRLCQEIMDSEMPILEYGIVTVKIDRVF